MAKYSITPLDELRLAKKKAREEKAIAEQRLSYQLQYLADNWGTLVTKGLSSSVRTKFVETIENISHGSFSSNTALPFMPKKKGYTQWVNLALANIPLISKVAWRLTKPTVYAFAAKKLTGKIFRRSSKKN